MNNLHEMWGSRFVYYVTELQRYLRYVFTGHLAIVMLFAIGAGGYAYSEWLKEVPAMFPASILTAIVIGVVLAYAPPVTLLHPADAVYFLPLEHTLSQYFKRAIGWTTFSQVLLPILLFIVAIPLLNKVEGIKGIHLLVIAIVIFAMKVWNVNTEFTYRWLHAGKGIWKDRLFRILLSIAVVYFVIKLNIVVAAVILLPMGIYLAGWRKAKKGLPFPYEHFIGLEQSRMMRFYRFANYFTDVPHLKGSVKRRRYLDAFIVKPFEGTSAHRFLVNRTFVRTTDIFYLWGRLLLIATLGAAFIPYFYVALIFVGALSFASAIQLVHSFKHDGEFRMDMLFPERQGSRDAAISKTVRRVQWLQAGAIMIGSFFQYGIGLKMIGFLFISIVISEVTIRFARKKKQEEY